MADSVAGEPGSRNTEPVTAGASRITKPAECDTKTPADETPGRRAIINAFL
jgi:hypothetical protein